MGSGGGVVVVSECMGGTRGSGLLCSTGDVLEMSVVRGVGGLCDMCMCLARGGMGGALLLTKAGDVEFYSCALLSRQT